MLIEIATLVMEQKRRLKAGFNRQGASEVKIQQHRELEIIQFNPQWFGSVGIERIQNLIDTSPGPCIQHIQRDSPSFMETLIRPKSSGQSGRTGISTPFVLRNRQRRRTDARFHAKAESLSRAEVKILPSRFFIVPFCGQRSVFRKIPSQSFSNPPVNTLRS